MNRALLNSTNCTRDYLKNKSDCPVEAQSVYQELHQVFLQSWCSAPMLLATTKTSTASQMRISSNINLLLTFYVIMIVSLRLTLL